MMLYTCINARRARATAGREGGLSEPRARLVKLYTAYKSTIIYLSRRSRARVLLNMLPILFDIFPDARERAWPVFPPPTQEEETQAQRASGQTCQTSNRDKYRIGTNINSISISFRGVDQTRAGEQI